MQLVKEAGRYIFRCRYEERHIPKAAGFRWDPRNRVWWTDDERIASHLVQYADPQVKAELDADMKARESAIALSQASAADVEIPAPEGLDYLPYQKAGILYASQRENVLIADEMGLGKTIQAIGIINNDETINNVLVICPASLRINWAREMCKWLVRDLTVAIADGDEFPETDVVIINFERLRKHRKALRARQWDILIVDEAHYIKNAKAQRTGEIVGRWDRKKGGWAVEPLQARKKVLMTGTPIVNRPAELWTLIRYLDKKRWNNFMSFARRYCDARPTRFGWDFSGANQRTLPELQQILRETIMVRRTKTEVLKELPSKRRQIIEIPADGMKKLIDAERGAWDKHGEAILAMLNAEDDYEGGVNRLKADTAVFSELSQVRHETALAKVPYVVEHLKMVLESEDKVVVFAHHHDVVDAIVAAFEGEAVKVTGRESADERQAAVDRFQNDADCKVFVGTIRAAGVGLTLTAASVVVFAELDWTPGAVTQAEDRVHRIGQDRSVLVQHIVIDGSIDAKIAKVLLEKQNVIDRALSAKSLEDVEETGHETQTPVQEQEKAEQTSGFPRQTIKSISEHEYAAMTTERITAIHSALRLLAGLDGDFASERNDVGYNKHDSRLGHELARLDSLMPKQAAMARRMLRKYRRQIPQHLLKAMGMTKTGRMRTR